MAALDFTRCEVLPSIGHAVAHLKTPDEVVSAQSPNYRVLVSISPSPEGMILASVLTGVLATSLMIAGIVISRQLLSLPSDPSVALLLVAPGAVSTLLTRPGEHILTSKLLRGVRLLVLAPGLATFAAAAVLVTKPPVNVLVDSWMVLGTVATTATLLLSWIAVRGVRTAKKTRNVSASRT